MKPEDMENDFNGINLKMHAIRMMREQIQRIKDSLPDVYQEYVGVEE
mgnify:CR=1 FL=1|tara:strand:+ start:240 stop:380 length:141 start_codon:yes stop_codon:yes gene_type:complete